MARFGEIGDRDSAKGDPGGIAFPSRSADAIVVLGCRIEVNGQPSPAAQRRVDAAARAFRLGWGPRVIASGGRRWQGTPEACALRRALEQAGVPPESIEEELCSFTTWENALFCARHLQRGLDGPTPTSPQKRVVAVVTCPWHMPRALDNFVAAGLDPFPVPAEPPQPSAWRGGIRTVHEAISTMLDRRRRRRDQWLVGSGE